MRQISYGLCSLLLGLWIGACDAASLAEGWGARAAFVTQAARPLVESGSAASLVPPRGGQARAGAALFAGREAGGLFAPVAPRRRGPAHAGGAGRPVLTGSDVAGLRDLIASAEAGPAGYNAVVWSARIKPPRAPTAMTIEEIFAWISATPGQNHAIGRYQFIPSTLDDLVRRTGMSRQARFGPAVQDKLADQLLMDAGLSEFLAGALARAAFMHNLAGIWAGLPGKTGRSRYHGYAGNKAVLSWARFDAEMARLFSNGAAQGSGIGRRPGFALGRERS